MGSLVSKTSDPSGSTGKEGAHSPAQQQLSRESNALLKGVAEKFSELERFSLRQVLQQVHLEHSKSHASGQHDRAENSRKPFSFDEDAFVTFLRIPAEECQAAKLFFRSFCHLSIYPDRIDASSPQTRGLGFYDLLKPLAFYCHKLPDNSPVNVHPLRVIFESFAEIPPSPSQLPSVHADTLTDAIENHTNNTNNTNNIISNSSNNNSNNNSNSNSNNNNNNNNNNNDHGGSALQRSKTMEDSLRSLTLQENFDWDPDNDLSIISSGPRIRATDIVHVLAGVLWLIQAAANEASPTKPLATMPVFLELARKRVCDMVIYSRKDACIHDPVDLAQESIDYEAFSSYVNRNMPNIFEILSPFFYNLFLIGNTMTHTPQARPVDSSAELQATKSKPLFPESTLEIPVATLGSSPSDILTPSSLAVLSTFAPLRHLQRSTPLTCLYSGNLHGFSMNQFELHVCKYPAPTLLLILAERCSDSTPTLSSSSNGASSSATTKLARRTSVSFETMSARHRHSISSSSSVSPSFAKASWGADARRASMDRSSIASGNNVRSPLASSASCEVAGGNNSPPQNDQGHHQSPRSSHEATTASPPPPMEVPSSSVPRPSSDGASLKASPRMKRRMILGAYVAETWKVSKSGWGNDACMLFELSPEFEVFPARSAAMTTTTTTTNEKPRSFGGSPPTSGGGRNVRLPPISTTSYQPPRHFVHFVKNVGIGFGGQETESCMLFLDDNLRYGTFRQDYASGGNIYMNSAGGRRRGFEVDFEIVDCEVWGLGGPEAKARQRKEWDFEQREANRRASIHIRSKDGEQDIDRDLLEMAGVLEPDRGHRHARRKSTAV